jgi:translation initiation factor 2 alpha subunit (eIF-2alpha)
MNRWTVVVLLGLLGSTAWAAPKPCEELKQEIEVKIQAAGVPSYTLEIVDNDEVQDQSMVVGSCAGGTKKIIYQKNGSEVAPPRIPAEPQ